MSKQFKGVRELCGSDLDVIVNSWDGSQILNCCFEKDDRWVRIVLNENEYFHIAIRVGFDCEPSQLIGTLATVGYVKRLRGFRIVGKVGNKLQRLIAA